MNGAIYNSIIDLKKNNVIFYTKIIFLWFIRSFILNNNFKNKRCIR